jgi:hypothetical protein
MKICQQFCISFIPTDLTIVSLAVRPHSRDKITTPLYCLSISLVLDVDDPLSRTSSASAASRIEVSAFCLKPSAARSRLLAISSSSDNNNRSLRECVIESKLVAARTYKGISFWSGHTKARSEMNWCTIDSVRHWVSNASCAIRNLSLLPICIQGRDGDV